MRIAWNGQHQLKPKSIPTAIFPQAPSTSDFQREIAVLQDFSVAAIAGLPLWTSSHIVSQILIVIPQGDHMHHHPVIHKKCGRVIPHGH